jgi:hypothetical protein
MNTSFQELRNFICETNKGKVFDSLICVELGLDYYEAFFDAHRDIHPEETSFEELVMTFLPDVYEYIGFQDDIEALLMSVSKG